MGCDELANILEGLTRDLAGQNERLHPDEHGRREADARLAREIVDAFSAGVVAADGQRCELFEATCLERARGGFHVNIAVRQPPGDTRVAAAKVAPIAQALIEPNVEQILRTTIAVRSARAPADPWQPPPEFKYDPAKRALTDLQQTIVAARSLKGAREPWQPLPDFDFDPIEKQWIGAKHTVIHALAALIRGWMASREQSEIPPSSMPTLGGEPPDKSR